MRKFHDSIPPEEVESFLLATRAEKRQLNLRVTTEAVRILEEEATRIGTGRANALEAILREIRELRKRRKK
jgi:hypothetical protein